MNIFTRFSNALDSFKANPNAPAPQATTIQTGSRVPIPRRREYTSWVNEGYKKNRVVAACMGVRAQSLGEPPCVVVGEDGELNPHHPISLLLRKPNPTQSQAQFWQANSIYIDGGGMSYIVKQRGIYGQVVALWPYNIAQMAPVYNDMGWTTGYCYAQGTKHEKWFVADDVIVLKHPMYVDPMDLSKGMSSIALAANAIEIYNELAETVYSLVSNGVPIGVFNFEQELNTQAQDSIKRQLSERQEAPRGPERTRPMFMGKGTYTQMGLDAQKLQAKELVMQCEIEICSVFGIDGKVVGTIAGNEKSTYANVETAYKEFTTLTRMPTWNSWEEQIESGLAKEWPGIQLEFDMSHVAALRADPDANIYPNIAKFNANLTTQNEARNAMGDLPIEGGDKFAYQVIPAPTFGALSHPDNPNRVDDVDVIESVLEKSGDGLTKKIKWNEQKAQIYWKTQEDAVQRATVAITGEVRNMFDAALRQLTSGKALEFKADKLNLRTLLEQFMSATGAIRQKLLTDIVDLAVTSVGGDLTLVQSFMDDIATDATREVTAKVKESLGTMQSDIIRVFDANAGKPASEISAALKAQFETMKGSRADTIAKTTCKAQSSRTLNSTWEGMNARETNPKRKLKSVWLTQRDGDVRPSHEEMDGQVVDMGAPFTSGDGYTLNGPALGDEAGEAINCRCTVRAVRAGQL